MKNSENSWWSEKYGFFGDFYMEGDDSEEGYLVEKKQKLNERTKTEVNGVIKLLSLEDSAKILDCPCGYGRHTIEFARRGFDVIGSDINLVHLEKAKAQAKKKSLEIIFRKESMLNLNYSNKFDAVVNLFYSFGFFDTDEENEKVLQIFFNALKPG